MCVLCFYNSLFPLRYKLPKGKVGRNYLRLHNVHSPDSVRDRQVAEDAEPDGDEFDLKQVPEGGSGSLLRLPGGCRQVVSSTLSSFLRAPVPGVFLSSEHPLPSLLWGDVAAPPRPAPVLPEF